MKRALALALALTLTLLVFAACGGSGTTPDTSSSAPATDSTPSDTSGDGSSADGSFTRQPIPKEELKIGVIHHLDTADQGYTYNHDLGIRYMMEKLDIDESQYLPKFNISDQDEALQIAAISELIDAGCQIIFATGFGYGIQCEVYGEQYPNVEFCHATGTSAHTSGLPNLHNYFAKIHQARYLAGVVAGMKAKEIGNPKLGYIAAFPFAEVISGYTAFYLGAQSVYPEAVMDVIYINSWGDAIREAEVAQSLIDRGCGVISQHSDNVAPATVAEANGAFHVGYNNDMSAAAPGASLISARVNWGIYTTIAIQHMIDGTPIPLDWSEGVVEGATDDGAAYLSPLNTAIAAEGTQEALDAAIAELLGGKHVFSGALKDNSGNPLELYNYGGNNIFTFTDENSAFLEGDVASGGTSAPAFSPKEGVSLQGINIVE